jgi:hypothetical protein
MPIPCPHCGQMTELMLAVPPQEPLVPRKVILWTLVALLILGLGLAGTLLALDQAKKLAVRQKQPVPAQSVGAAKPEDPAAKAGFSVSPIRLEKVNGSSLVYAVGTLTNETDRRRFGIRVEIELQDDAGKKLGEAKDYQPVLEPHGQWGFKALVNDSAAVSARLAGISEEK